LLAGIRLTAIASGSVTRLDAERAVDGRYGLHGHIHASSPD